MDYIDLKYINMASVHLDQFKKVNTEVYNFRCPICNDSTKNKTKARGYIFVKSDLTLYHCHNCGSPEHRTFGKLLKFLSEPLYKEYRIEKFRDKLGMSNHIPSVNKIEIDESKLYEEELKTKNELASKKILKHCTKVSMLDEDHLARKYVEMRMIPNLDALYYVNDINLVTSNIDKYNEKKFKEVGALVIPFIGFDGVINCIQFRFIDNEAPLRYLTLHITDNNDSYIYGLNELDINKLTYCCEGPINSMFIDNCIAVAGSKQFSKLIFLKDIIDNDIVLIFDNDYKSNIDVFNSINKAIDAGLKVVLYDSKISTNEDINDLVVKHGWSKNQIMEYLKSRTFSGLQAKLVLSENKKPNNKSERYIRSANNSDLMGKLKKTMRS